MKTLTIACLFALFVGTGACTQPTKTDINNLSDRIGSGMNDLKDVISKKLDQSIAVQTNIGDVLKNSLNTQNAMAASLETLVKCNPCPGPKNSNNKARAQKAAPAKATGSVKQTVTLPTVIAPAPPETLKETAPEPVIQQAPLVPGTTVIQISGSNNRVIVNPNPPPHTPPPDVVSAPPELLPPPPQIIPPPKPQKKGFFHRGWCKKRCTDDYTPWMGKDRSPRPQENIVLHTFTQ